MTTQAAKTDPLKARPNLTHDRQIQAAKPLDTLHQLDFIGSRDKRLKMVKGSSVSREINILGGLFKYAIQELHIITDSPLKNMSKPQNPSLENTAFLNLK